MLSLYNNLKNKISAAESFEHSTAKIIQNQMSNESSHTHGRLGPDLTTRALCIARAVTSYGIKTCLPKHLDSEVRLPCVMNCIFYAVH